MGRKRIVFSRDKQRGAEPMVQGVIIEADHIVDTNPADGSVIARVPISTPAVVDEALQAAKAAQPSWEQTPLSERCERIAAAVKSLTPKAA